jgi:hypothetical protein
MFDGPDFPKSLDENTFNRWLEKGRQSRMGYNYLLVVWDHYQSIYQPVYIENRNEINQYEMYNTSTGREGLVAAYDLYSESRIA